jgi:hypothetical protein
LDPKFLDLRVIHQLLTGNEWYVQEAPTAFESWSGRAVDKVVALE